MSAWVVFRLQGSSKQAVCVALTEADAREAAALYAIREAADAGNKIARLTCEGDEHHDDGWFVVLLGAFRSLGDYATDDDVTFGFQRVDVWGER